MLRNTLLTFAIASSIGDKSGEDGR